MNTAVVEKPSLIISVSRQHERFGINGAGCAVSNLVNQPNTGIKPLSYTKQVAIVLREMGEYQWWKKMYD